jgi:hypothetical protein
LANQREVTDIYPVLMFTGNTVVLGASRDALYNSPQVKDKTKVNKECYS